MSLATTCPHCQTTFNVANDQLKVKNGLVQCGICRSVFNGIDHLRTTEAATAVPKQRATDLGIQQVSGSPILSFGASQAAEEVTLNNGESGTEQSTESTKPIALTPTQTNIPPHFIQQPPHESGNHANHLADRATQPIEQLSFIREANAKKRRFWLFFIGTLILLLMLAGQTIFLFRDLMAATFPASKKTLNTFCHYAGCQIQLPAQPGALSYEADELLSLAHPHHFEFSLLLRNHSRLTQAWPHIELTLKNPQKQPVLRRVFTPAEYLAGSDDIATGLLAHQEKAVKMYFELDQIPASDYSVAIFYP